MNPIFAAALETQNLCERESWDFCVIGGIAVQRWGEPRLTEDADLSVLTGFGHEAAYIDSLLKHFKPRIADAKAFALQNRVLLLFASNGIHIDIALAAMPFEARAIARSSMFPIGSDVGLRTCSAEDLIVFKTFAGRDKDWLDVEGVITRQADTLDAEQIWHELKPLLELKEDEVAAKRLQTLLDQKQ